MIFPAVIVAIVLLAIGVLVAVGLEPGAPPAEVALGFEHAWDLLDFDAVYKLSGSELHDGLGRPEFVAAKREAYRDRAELGRLVCAVSVESQVQEGEAAVVITRLDLRDGSVVHHAIQLVRRTRTWQVVGYALHPAAAG